MEKFSAAIFSAFTKLVDFAAGCQGGDSKGSEKGNTIYVT